MWLKYHFPIPGVVKIIRFSSASNATKKPLNQRCSCSSKALTSKDWLRPNMPKAGDFQLWQDKLQGSTPKNDPNHSPAFQLIQPTIC